MSLMPRFFPPSPFATRGNEHGPAGEFSSLFRFLDDYTSHVTRRFDDTFSELNRSVTAATFAPRFDIHETGEGYHLEGEFPGIEKEALQIEFLDENTLQIKGRIERKFSSGTPASSSPSHAASEDVTMSGAINEKQTSSNAENTDSTENTQVASSNAESSSPATTDSATTDSASSGHYWVTERSVGEFSRIFSFPAPIVQDAVKASLKNGVLSITVPKKVADEAAVRRIAIE